MLRALLAIMHPLLRAALLEYIQTGNVLCEIATSGEELWDQLRHYDWDILILDLRLPQCTKLQTVRAVHTRYPNLPILAISFGADLPSRYWQEAGASGLVLKTNLGTELIGAVQVVSQGAKYFPTGGPEEKIP